MREVCNNRETAGTWLKKNIPDPKEFLVWKEKCVDELRSLLQLPAQGFSLETFKREVCNNRETAADWLTENMPNPEEFSLWRGKCVDEVHGPDFVRRNKVNGFMTFIEKPSSLFAIFRLEGSNLEALFLIKGQDTSVISALSDSFTLTPEDMGGIVEAIVTHGDGEFEDYILK